MLLSESETVRERAMLASIFAGIGLLLFGINHLAVTYSGLFYAVALIGGWFAILVGIPGLIYEPISLTRRLRSDLPPRSGPKYVEHTIEVLLVVLAFGLAEATARIAYGLSLF
jgi:hypothetical protein